LFGDGLGVIRVSLEDPDSYRKSIGTGKQTDNDLLLAPLLVTVVAPGCQFVAIAFKVGACYVVQEEGWSGVWKPKPKQFFFDLFLMLGKPSKVLVEIILVKLLDAKQFANCVAHGKPYGGQSGALIDNPGDDLQHCQPGIQIRAERLRQSDSVSKDIQEPHGSDTLAQRYFDIAH